jgi:nucleotide-binding universal stress UspA family protein
MKDIVLAYDCSASADKAFAFGLDLAVRYQAALHVLSVARPPEPPSMVETQEVLEESEARFRESYRGLDETAREQGLEPRFEVRAGHPAEQIVRYAEEVEADVIILGHRGHSLSFVDRWLVGSISKRVLTYAHCTVIVVR